MFRFISVLALMAIVSSAFAEDKLVNRLKLIDDRFKTQEMMRPLGHDFYIDLSAAANTNAQDFIDDMDKLGSLTGTDQEKFTQAGTVFEQYYNTEQFLRVRFGFGVPIFSFTAFGTKIKPNFRVDGGLTGVISITRETLTLSTLADYLSSNVDPAIVSAIKSCTSAVVTGGQKLIAELSRVGCITTEQKTALDLLYPNDITVPTGLDTGVVAPVADIYLKGDAKAGVFFDFEKDHWFGQFGFYALGRADIRQGITSQQLVSDNADVIDLGEELNTTINSAIDLTFGYKNSNYRILTAIEEFHLAELSENEAGTQKPEFGEDVLFRLHADATFNLWIFHARGFVGSHARSGYGLGDAYYVGADWGGHVWGNRLGVNVRTQIDEEHFTLAPRFKLWLMQLEYTLKTPLKDEINGVKPSTIHMLNFRAMI